MVSSTFISITEKKVGNEVPRITGHVTAKRRTLLGFNKYTVCHLHSHIKLENTYSPTVTFTEKLNEALELWHDLDAFERKYQDVADQIRPFGRREWEGNFLLFSGTASYRR